MIEAVILNKTECTFAVSQSAEKGQSNHAYVAMGEYARSMIQITWTL